MEGKVFQSLQVLGMKEDLWERVRGLDSMTWNGVTINLGAVLFGNYA